MIHFNENLTQEQARYIMEEVIPKAGWRIDRTTLSYWEKAHNYAFHEQVGQPGCSCEFVATMGVWQSRISQYKPQIEEKAYPPVVVEPSEIIVEAVTEVQTLPNEIRVKTRKSRKSN
jgi:hypothetical protein